MHGSIPEFIKAVFQKFGWKKPYQVDRRQNTWLVSCPKGRFFLKQSKVSWDDLSFIHKILKKIHEKGYTNLLPFIHTKDGKTVISEQGKQWYATPWKESRQKPAVRELVQSLARFHRYAEREVQNERNRFTVIDQNWLRRWQKKQEEIKSEKEQLDQKEFPSPFDYSFSKHYATIHQSLQFALRGMEKFRKVEHGKAPRYTLCHNRIHPSNIVCDEKDFYWVDFDHASIDSPVRDLSLFIQRYAHLESPKKLLQLYEQVYELYPIEKRLLAVYLAYPERVLKRLRQYHHSLAISSEPHSQRRFEKEIEHLIKIQQLVVDLWPVKN